MAVALRLPRAAALTEELLSPVPDVEQTELRAVRELLVEALTPIAAEIPPGQRLVLDAFGLSVARRQPERCASAPPPFVPTPGACRRAVGVAAVERCLRRRAAGPVHAVADVLAAGLDDAVEAGSGGVRAPWWATWYASLGDGGRAVVAAEAVTWATQLWTALDWGVVDGPVVVGGHDDWWDLPGSRSLVLKGRADVRARVGTRGVLVVMRTGIPDTGSRAELLFPALVSALAGAARAVPGRVLGIWPASGQVRVVPVDTAALRACARDVVSAAATWVDGLIEQASPERARAGTGRSRRTS